jgi:hypothetical protein
MKNDKNMIINYQFLNPSHKSKNEGNNSVQNKSIISVITFFFFLNKLNLISIL